MDPFTTDACRCLMLAETTKRVSSQHATNFDELEVGLKFIRNKFTQWKIEPLFGEVVAVLVWSHSGREFEGWSPAVRNGCEDDGGMDMDVNRRWILTPDRRSTLTLP